MSNINRGEDFESSLNTRKEAVMRQVTSAMVRQEKKIKRPERSHKKLLEELDPAFAAWHKARMLWLKRLYKALRKRRKCGARRFLRYPGECKELDLEGKVIEDLMETECLSVLRSNVR